MDPKSIIIGTLFGLINTRLIYVLMEKLLQGVAGSEQANENMRVSRAMTAALVGFKILLLGCLVYVTTQEDLLLPLPLLCGFALGITVGLIILGWRDRSRK